MGLAHISGKKEISPRIGNLQGPSEYTEHANLVPAQISLLSFKKMEGSERWQNDRTSCAVILPPFEGVYLRLAFFTYRPQDACV